jgi:hypothetical protein
MRPLPHDLSDLALAPVVLSVDDQLDSFSGLDRQEVAMRVVLETNREPRDREQRAAAALETVLRFIDLHGWEAQWTRRGLRLAHGPHAVTLGVPRSLQGYVEGV